MSCDEDEQGCNYWLKLPRDIIITILQKLGVSQIFKSAQFVCTEWRDICTDASMWSTIRLAKGWYFRNEYRTRVENMTRSAVDRSCGSLFDLDLDGLTSKELLHYVVERCTRIRRLRIEYNVEGLATKLPLLEDLEIFGSSYFSLSSEEIETLGRYCPRLRSLKVVVHRDKEAKTIARSMPQLQHICLSGTYLMTEGGVEALLDGCPHLESLVIDIQTRDDNIIRGAFQMMKLPMNSTWRIHVKTKELKLYRRDTDIKYVEDAIRRAVDKSCGGLVVVDLGKFAPSGDFLSYLVERCTQIRRLSLNVSEIKLRAAAPRLSLLENLKCNYFISAETIETFERCCPRLNSLEIRIDDDGARTLARSLLQLHHLKPLEHCRLTNVGVEALLGGCSHLVSLDLRKCHLVEWSTSFTIECVQRIKHMISNGLLKRHYLCRLSCFMYVKSHTEQDGYDYDQFFDEEEEDDDVYDDVSYMIEEYWSRRGKIRSRGTRIRHLRREKVNKNRSNRQNSPVTSGEGVSPHKGGRSD